VCVFSAFPFRRIINWDALLSSPPLPPFLLGWIPFLFSFSRINREALLFSFFLPPCDVGQLHFSPSPPAVSFLCVKVEASFPPPSWRRALRKISPLFPSSFVRCLHPFSLCVKKSGNFFFSSSPFLLHNLFSFLSPSPPLPERFNPFFLLFPANDRD